MRATHWKSVTLSMPITASYPPSNALSTCLSSSEKRSATAVVQGSRSCLYVRKLSSSSLNGLSPMSNLRINKSGKTGICSSADCSGSPLRKHVLLSKRKSSKGLYNAACMSDDYDVVTYELAAINPTRGKKCL